MKSESGLSLIESLLVVAMVGVIVILLANLPNALGLMAKSNHLSLARDIAAKQIEDKRAISFANLANDSSAVADLRIALLPQGSGTMVVEDYEENIKRIKVTISWKDRNIAQNISLTTLIGKGGINQ